MKNSFHEKKESEVSENERKGEREREKRREERSRYT